ncbi:MAG: SAM-dependent methyltransferase [Dongiaceae bacterium]
MTPLAERLARRIREGGPLTVAAYMAEALGNPEHGYYRRGDPFGVAGDFITAPEISQMFGELIGLWCAETWRRMGGPDPVRLVELGPGRGTLMADALRAVRLVPEFRAAIDLHLVETSPLLRVRQAKMLRAAELTPAWHDDFAGVPDGPLLLVANEFFDALPIHQFQRVGDFWRERVVALDAQGRGFRFALAAAGPAAALPAPADAPDGAIAEICPAGRDLAAAIGARVARDGGAALIVDYGPAESAAGDSLQAVRRHRPVDPLADPGAADLTAHVDFAALARAAAAAGAAAHGPLPQGLLLDRLGILMRAAVLVQRATPAQVRDISTAARRLRDPLNMGRLFKALAIAAPGLAPPEFEPPWTDTATAEPC